jgi:hypothetical protein
MRTISLFFPLLLVASACAWHPYVNGTASYTATPALEGGSSGALPLRAVVCRDADLAVASLHLGDRCTLRGAWEGAGRASGGTVRLRSQGDCALPFADAVKALQVTSATLSVLGGAVDATVGGTANDGRYVTYRFTGTTGGDAPAEACADLNARGPSTDGTTAIAPGREAWESSAAAPMATGGKR